MTGEKVRIGGLEVDYKLDGVATGAGSGLFELTVAPGARVPPPHSHTANEETIYVLQGVLRYCVDGEMRDLAAGEHMHTPRGSVHSFSNPHAEAARALVMLTPDIGAQYFRDVAEVVGQPGPPDPAALTRVMERYGLVLAKPAA
ncbi:MAG TPA: cupin domain-containing protein [Caulobacteraceae bacterium]|nr:cupin domain-containing protein [Caulobacteraceae bacterium]